MSKITIRRAATEAVRDGASIAATARDYEISGATLDRWLRAFERQGEGIAKAKAEGRCQGRKPTARALAGEVLALARPTTGAPGMGVTAIVATLKARKRKIERGSVYRILRAGDSASEHVWAAEAPGAG